MASRIDNKSCDLPHKHSWLALAALALSAATGLAQQAASPCAATNDQITVHKLSSEKIAQVLNQPNGMENIAKLAGHFFTDLEGRPLETADIDSLLKVSSVIGLGTIKARHSEIVPDGDDAGTEYTVHMDVLLKGTVPTNGDVAFWASGGCIAFPDGTTAERSTQVWRYLKIGKQYLLFLEKSQNVFVISGGIEGVGRVTSSSGEFEIGADFDKRGHHIISDRPKSLTLGDLANKLKLMH